MKFVSISLITLFLLGCTTTESSNTRKDYRSGDDTKQVSKFAFFNRIDNESDQVICIRNKAFPPCVNITVSNCKRTVQDSLPSCKTKLEPLVPDMMPTSTASQFGREIADCLYYSVMKSVSAEPYKVRQCVDQYKRLNPPKR